MHLRRYTCRHPRLCDQLLMAMAAEVVLPIDLYRIYLFGKKSSTFEYMLTERTRHASVHHCYNI